jgi:hypothetical protein
LDFWHAPHVRCPWTWGAWKEFEEYHPSRQSETCRWSGWWTRRGKRLVAPIIYATWEVLQTIWPEIWKSSQSFEANGTVNHWILRHNPKGWWFLLTTTSEQVLNMFEALQLLTPLQLSLRGLRTGMVNFNDKGRVLNLD